jgi:hypothetical protein
MKGKKDREKNAAAVPTSLSPFLSDSVAAVAAVALTFTLKSTDELDTSL